MQFNHRLICFDDTDLEMRKNVFNGITFFNTVNTFTESPITVFVCVISKYDDVSIIIHTCWNFDAN